MYIFDPGYSSRKYFVQALSVLGSKAIHNNLSMLFLQEKEAELIESRRLRAEQDLAFEESLRADMAKV